MKVCKVGKKYRENIINGVKFSNDELFQQLNSSRDFCFIETVTGNDITYKSCLNLIKSKEKINRNNIDLNSVIRSGGFVDYIKGLERLFSRLILTK